ncbi:unnamed protein product [Rotaria socialis]|uniref:Uncharacterized protein n=3 Tax=Rotaria socialis TaxID=392032 RepID=A0A818RJ14_9BILA|nr:unnamed protein product [Rotaria socialis]CAF4797161.1 unnamed protein product [Rotaria socialis]
MEHTQHDSTRNPYYPTNSRSTTYNIDDRLSDSCNRLLWSPTISDDYSQIADARENNRTTIPILPTQSNHYQRLLGRSEANYPTHINSKNHTNWPTTGETVRHDQELLLNHDSFHGFKSHCDRPFHVHRRTPSILLESLIQKVSTIHLFTITTTSDNSTSDIPKSIPALIQIQAIRDEELSVVILVEVQHLPHRSTPLFQKIQQLCHTIFSRHNKIMAWGDVISELRLFASFSLFDLSHITNHLNLQTNFTNEWNKAHPHTFECMNRYQSVQDDDKPDDSLICLVNSDDLDNDLYHMDSTSDFTFCMCPDSIRPYKNVHSMWSLKMAIRCTFNTTQDQYTRESPIEYAISDLFALTKLYIYWFYNKFDFLDRNSMNTSTATSIPHHEQTTLPLYFILSDRHGKNLHSTINTPHYQITTRSISGLQWVNTYNHTLCTQTVLNSPSISSILSSVTGVLFLIGTSSVRSMPALRIIQQVEAIVNMIRLNHHHIDHLEKITIAATFPCLKVSSCFPNIDLLLNNINLYNQQLEILSRRLGFSFLDFHITPEHLHRDHLHLQHQYKNILHATIVQYFDSIIAEQNKSPQSQHRTSTAITRRNKRRHEKRKEKQQQHILTRSLSQSWTIPDIKNILKHHAIKFARICSVANHKIRIQFNNTKDQQHADNLISLTFFDDNNFAIWHEQK